MINYLRRKVWRYFVELFGNPCSYCSNQTENSRGVEFGSKQDPMGTIFNGIRRGLLFGQ
jgi:hypothetical protein